MRSLIYAILILKGESKSPTHGRPKVSACFYFFALLFRDKARVSAPSKTILFQIVGRKYTFLTW